MPTTGLSESDITGIITTLQLALGTPDEVTVTAFADGRRVERRVKSDAEKLEALNYFEGLLAQVRGTVRARRLVLASTSGVEP